MVNKNGNKIKIERNIELFFIPPSVQASNRQNNNALAVVFLEIVCLFYIFMLACIY